MFLLFGLVCKDLTVFERSFKTSLCIFFFFFFFVVVCLGFVVGGGGGGGGGDGLSVFESAQYSLDLYKLKRIQIERWAMILRELVLVITLRAMLLFCNQSHYSLTLC